MAGVGIHGLRETDVGAHCCAKEVEDPECGDDTQVQFPIQGQVCFAPREEMRRTCKCARFPQHRVRCSVLRRRHDCLMIALGYPLRSGPFPAQGPGMALPSRT